MEATLMCANERATAWEHSQLFYRRSSWRRSANYCWRRLRREATKLTKLSMFSVSPSWPNQLATNWCPSSMKSSPCWASWCRRSPRSNPMTWTTNFQKHASPHCSQSSTSVPAN
jgi:hypothetical protein